MNRLLPFLVAALVLTLAAAPSAGRDKTPRYNDPSENYKAVPVAGWTVMVNKRLNEHPELRREALEQVQWELWVINRLVDKKAGQVLKKVKIWLELDAVNTAQYHPSRDWLANNHYNPAKAKGIDIGNASRWTDRIPGRACLTLLHELCHAYHDQVLGFDEERVVAAYNRSRESGTYDRVVRDRHVEVRHYAMANHKEWFAEISETYLWTNDYYPFNRAELKKIDPHAYALMEQIWGQRTPTEAEIRERAKKTKP
ncbi:MAG: hypothetical protein OER86_08565 [Phycisphaerae bacterium]|nr:hypothetical protein [Phycisphaerae bacterium]